MEIGKTKKPAVSDAARWVVAGIAALSCLVALPGRVAASPVGADAASPIDLAAAPVGLAAFAGGSENARYTAPANLPESSGGHTASAAAASPRSGAAQEPFLVGALGVLPIMSGFYITGNPMRGLVFSLMDGLLILGIANAREDRQQDSRNAKVYYGLMALNNALDAGLSIWQSSREQRLRARLELRPGGGMEIGLAWNP